MRTYKIKHIGLWNGDAFTIRYNLVIDNACDILRELKAQKIAQGYTITESATSGVAEYNFFCYTDDKGHEYMVRINRMY